MQQTVTRDNNPIMAAPPVALAFDPGRLDNQNYRVTDEEHIIIRDIMFLVSRKHMIGTRDMQSSNRNREIVAARCEAIWRIRSETNLSLPQIALIFNCHHTTVLLSVRRYEKNKKSKKSVGCLSETPPRPTIV